MRLGASQPHEPEQLQPRQDVVAAHAAGNATQSMQQLPSQVARQEQVPADCLGCRITGLMLGLGGAGYVSSRLFEEPKPRGAHRYSLIAVSAGLFALGVSRALGF